jgi:hypothetical protein
LALAGRQYVCGDTRERKFNRLFEKNVFVLKLLDYFHLLYQRTAEHYRIFGHNLVELFVKEEVKRLSDDVNAAVLNIMQLLLGRLLPEGTHGKEASFISVDADTYAWFTNPFLEFLLKKYRQAREHNDAEAARVLRKEFSIVVQLGFFGNRSLMFCKLWQNESLLKALMLSYEVSLLEQVFLIEFTVKGHIERVHLLYQEIKDAMHEKQVAVVEKWLFLNNGLRPQELEVDANELRFEEWLDEDTPSEIVTQFNSISTSILENEVDFANSLERLDYQLLTSMRS